MTSSVTGHRNNALFSAGHPAQTNFPRRATGLNRLRGPALSILWGGLILVGFIAFASYSGTPGAMVEPPPVWPVASCLARTPGRPAMLVFLHPKCPCSVATVGELARLLPAFGDAVDVTVIFARPSQMPGAWEKGELWSSVEELASVRCILDEGRVETELFRARTSGQVVLYDCGGRLVFSGGITPARSHWGDSEGRQAVLDFIRGGNPSVNQTPVFGCPIFEGAGPSRKGCDRCRN